MDAKGIERLTERLDHLSERVERLEARFGVTIEVVGDLAQRISHEAVIEKLRDVQTA